MTAGRDTPVLPRTDTSDPLPERAFTLYCQGLRSDTIAARLGVPARTVRRWLQKTRDQLAVTTREQRIAELLRAIESQRTVVATAWDAYHRECRIEDEILAGHHDRLYRRILRPSPHDPAATQTPRVTSPSPSAPPSTRGGAPCGGVTSGAAPHILLEEYDRPRRFNTGARYLAVIVAAQREIARLQGLYDQLDLNQPNHISITITRRPDGPENLPPDKSTQNGEDPA